MVRRKRDLERGEKREAIVKLVNGGMSSGKEITDKLNRRGFDVSYNYVSKVVREVKSEPTAAASNGVHHTNGASEGDFEQGVEAAIRTHRFVEEVGGVERARQLLNKVAGES